MPEYYTEDSRVAKEASETLYGMPAKRRETLDISYFPGEPASEMLFIDGLQAHWYKVYNETAEPRIRARLGSVRLSQPLAVAGKSHRPIAAV